MTQTTTSGNRTHRRQVRLWLDALRDEERELLDYIDLLKLQRRFTQSIREALYLLRDLRAGRLDWLLYLFPWVYPSIYAQAEAELRAQQEPAESHETRLMAEIQRLSAQLEAMGAVPLQNALPGLQRAPAALAASVEPEPTIEIERRESSGQERLYNLLLSTASLQGRFDGLGTEVLRYGLDQGKVRPQQLQPATLERIAHAAQDTVAMPAVTGNAKQMRVPAALPPPDWDEDDDDDGLMLPQ